MSVFSEVIGFLKNLSLKSYSNGSPANGDIWFDGTDVCVRSNGTTRKLTVSYTAHGLLIGNGYGDIAAASAGTAGQVMVSGGASADPDFSSSFIGKTWTKRKAGDQDISTSTAFQDDAEHVIPILANEKKDGFILAQWVVGAGNLKIRFTVPSGCTATMTGIITSGGFQSVDATASKSLVITLTASSYFYLLVDFQNGANAGDIQFQFSQNTSNGANTTHKKGSIFQLTRYE